MDDSMYNLADKKIDSLLSLIGIVDKSEIAEKLSQASFVEFSTVVKNLISATESVSSADVKIPTNGKELQETVMRISTLLEGNGVDLSAEYERTLNTVLSNFLNDLEGKVDAQAMANARTFLAQ